MAPSTLGTFLRAFTFGHIRQLDRVLGEALRRAWALGAGPGSEHLVIDLDSTICEVCGKAKHGAGYGYTKKLGYHPMLATRAWTGEVLHVRMRKGAANTQRGARAFRGGAGGPGAPGWSHRGAHHALRLGLLVQRHDRHPGASRRRLHHGRAHDEVRDRAVEGIDEAAWTPIDYTADGEAEVAECDYKGRRLIVRRTRLVGPRPRCGPSGDTSPS